MKKVECREALINRLDDFKDNAIRNLLDGREAFINRLALLKDEELIKFVAGIETCVIEDIFHDGQYQAVMEPLDDFIEDLFDNINSQNEKEK